MNELVELKLKGKTLKQIAKIKNIQYRKVRNKLYYSPLREELMSLKKERETKVRNYKRQNLKLNEIAKKTNLSIDQVKHILYHKDKR
jgi:hypothetical protein